MRNKTNVPAKMQQCAFYTAQFTRCTNQTPRKFCRTHLRKGIHLGAYPLNGFCACVRDDRWCRQPKQEGHDICADHVARIQAREDRRADRIHRFEEEAVLFQKVLEGYMTHQPPLSWKTIVRDCYHRTEGLRQKHPNYLPFKVATAVAKAAFHLHTHEPTPAAMIYFWAITAHEAAGVRGPPLPPPPHLDWLVYDPPEWWKE